MADTDTLVEEDLDTKTDKLDTGCNKYKLLYIRLLYLVTEYINMRLISILK